MTIIIGIDPGSRNTGFGVVSLAQHQLQCLAYGCIHLSADMSWSQRLQTIHQKIIEVIDQYSPTEAAIEQVFMHVNPGSALKLGQARGAAIVALKMPLAEYSARQVKQAVVGFGAAAKEQVQQMVLRLLNLNETLQADAADALAIAVCHAHSRHLQDKTYTRKNNKKRSTSWRQYTP